MRHLSLLPNYWPLRGSAVQDGRCKTLNQTADGYARGEACISHLLEHFEGAELQGLKDHALLVHGTAVNQDGRSSSLTVCRDLDCQSC